MTLLELQQLFDYVDYWFTDEKMKAANGNCNLLKYFFKLKKTIKNQNFKILYMFLFWTVGQK